MAHACRMTDPEGVHKKLVDQICKDLEAMGPDFANDDWDETIATQGVPRHAIGYWTCMAPTGHPSRFTRITHHLYHQQRAPAGLGVKV